MGEPDRDAYERGKAAGETDARLENAERRLGAVNGNIADVAVALEALRLAVQRLIDQAVARDATVVTTAMMARTTTFLTVDDIGTSYVGGASEPGMSALPNRPGVWGWAPVMSAVVSA